MLLSAHVLLSLRAVFSGIGLYSLRSIVGLLCGHFLDLGRLASNNLACMIETIVDSLTILDVDEWGEVGDDGRDQCETPEWDELDKPI